MQQNRRQRPSGHQQQLNGHPGYHQQQDGHHQQHGGHHVQPTGHKVNYGHYGPQGPGRQDQSWTSSLEYGPGVHGHVIRDPVDYGRGGRGPVVRDSADLHNISQDSGLSHSPTLQTESPQLTIGSPIRHIENARNGREKGGRWSLSGFFRRKSSKNSGSESDLYLASESFSGLRGRGGKTGGKVTNNSGSLTGNIVSDIPPPLPPKRSNSSGGRFVDSHPGIFPHLKPDSQYPDSDPKSYSGYYFHPSFGYVKIGSYYDQQISNWSRPAECLSSRSSGVDSDLTSSLDLALRDLDRNVESSSENETGSTTRKSVPHYNKTRSSSESRASARSSRSSSQGSSLAQRSRSARSESGRQRRRRDEGSVLNESTEDYSKDGSDKLEFRSVPTHSPYIHTAHTVSLGPGVLSSNYPSQNHNTQRSNLISPPAPPPRDTRRRPHLDPQLARPCSYSFETIRVPGENCQPSPRDPKILPAPINQLPIPPRVPQRNRLSLSDQYLWDTGTPPLRESSQKSLAPKRGAVSVPTTSSSPGSPLFIDPEPRSRKPILLYSSTPVVNIDDSVSDYLSATEFWAPHQQRLSSPPDSLTDNMSERNVKTPNRDSAIVSNISTPIPNCDSQSVSSFEKSGKSSPTSVSSKDSGCSEPKTSRSLLLTPLPLVPENLVSPLSGSNEESLPGFSTRKRRSHFREAISELESVCKKIDADEDLLDRAERRDLPTLHQELIWRGRGETGDTTSHDSSVELGFSDIDNIMNWNTSSSFEQLNSTPSRPRTPGNRRAGVSDKTLDDMAFRMKASANKIPTTMANSIGLSDQSYLLLSPLEQKEKLSGEEEPVDEDEPNIIVDDVTFRNSRDVNAGNIQDPQPKFGIPVGPITGGAISDYLHAVPQGKYRSTFHPMKNPDLVKDDLAFRQLRKDDNPSDPDHLGIVKDPHGIILPRRVWPFKQESKSSHPDFYPNPNRHTKVMRSLSEGMTEIIRKQSSKPSAEMNNLFSYQDIDDIESYNCMRYSLEKMNKEKEEAEAEKKKKKKKENRRSASVGRTVFEILRYGLDSEPESESESGKAEVEIDKTVDIDEGVVMNDAVDNERVSMKNEDESFYSQQVKTHLENRTFFQDEVRETSQCSEGPGEENKTLVCAEEGEMFDGMMSLVSLPQDSNLVNPSFTTSSRPRDQSNTNLETEEESTVQISDAVVNKACTQEPGEPQPVIYADLEHNLEDPRKGHFSPGEDKEDDNNNGSCLIVQTVLIPETRLNGELLLGPEGEGWAEKLSWERSETEGRAEKGRKESLVHRAAEALGLDEKAVAEFEEDDPDHPL